MGLTFCQCNPSQWNTTKNTKIQQKMVSKDKVQNIASALTRDRANAFTGVLGMQYVASCLMRVMLAGLEGEKRVVTQA